MNKTAGRIIIAACVVGAIVFLWLIFQQQNSSPASQPSHTAPTTQDASVTEPIASVAARNATAGAGGAVTETSSSTSSQPLPGNTPDRAQLNQKLRAFVQSYYQVLPSDFTATSQPPIDSTKHISILAFDSVTQQLFTKHQASLHGDIDLTKIDIRYANSGSTVLNIGMPVTIRILKSDGSELLKTVFAQPDWPASDWSYKNGVWTMTNFTP
jgi:hypothetical protein